MQIERLIKLLQEPHTVTPEDVTDLQNVLHQYPFFQAAYALISKATYDKDHPSVGQEVQTAAIYATDRGHLKALLEENPPFSVPAAVPSATEATARDDLNQGHLSTLQQRAARQITKKTALDQHHLIQAFVQQEVNFDPKAITKASSETLQVDLAQDSATFHEDLATESLAQVLLQQGKVQRALAIYNQLMLKFPEKRTYLATLIKELKSTI